MAALVLPVGALAADHPAGGQAHSHRHGGVGKPGIAANVTRTVNIAMSDAMRYSPSDVEVKSGETVRFIVTNLGRVTHELSLGTEKELLEHREAMKKAPGMQHDEPGQLSLPPGGQGEIIWQFGKAGTVNFACLVPGHHEAGMKGTVKVSNR